ncbi:hypothetical protein [Sodalis sp. RH16]|uniref:hypothetical protein n=1 Tax=Sodalis sp. RH16 TaxID=3394331 RepID=UPI0039B6C223
MTPKISDVLKKELLEKLAAIEHERWAHWQKHLHSKCYRNKDGSLTIPSDLVEHWEKQIDTPYNALSDQEQDSDREQVSKILPILVEFIKKI